MTPGRWRRSSRCTRSAPDFIPEPIHAGGLRYHGMSPLVSLLKEHDFIEARSVHQRASFEAGVTFARAEGILPAPEPTHAIKVAIDEAMAAKEAGEARVILFNLCGHGHFDLSAYERYLSGALEDYEYPAERVAGGARGTSAGLIRTRRCSGSPAGDAAGGSRWPCAWRLSRATSDAVRDAGRRSRMTGGWVSDGTRPGAVNDPSDPGPPADGAPRLRERRTVERRSHRVGWWSTAGSSDEVSAPRLTRRQSGVRRRTGRVPAAILAAMRVGFLGFGLIGGSVARAPARRGTRPGSGSSSDGLPRATVLAGRQPMVSSTRRRGGRRTPSPGADLVMLAGPATACLGLLDDLAGPLGDALGADAVITDVASTKGALVRRADAAGLRYVGGHPMAGRETAGYEASSPDLFAGRPVGGRPGRGGHRRGRERVASLARACGGTGRDDGRRGARPGGRGSQPPAADPRRGAGRGGRGHRRRATAGLACRGRSCCHAAGVT